MKHILHPEFQKIRSTINELEDYVVATKDDCLSVAKKISTLAAGLVQEYKGLNIPESEWDQDMRWVSGMLSKRHTIPVIWRKNDPLILECGVKGKINLNHSKLKVDQLESTRFDNKISYVTTRRWIILLDAEGLLGLKSPHGV